jgi:hypothetical protein
MIHIRLCERSGPVRSVHAPPALSSCQCPSLRMSSPPVSWMDHPRTQAEADQHASYRIASVRLTTPRPASRPRTTHLSRALVRKKESRKAGRRKEKHAPHLARRAVPGPGAGSRGSAPPRHERRDGMERSDLLCVVPLPGGWRLAAGAVPILYYSDGCQPEPLRARSGWTWTGGGTY